LIKVNLVDQSIRVFTKRVGKHPRLRQTYKRTKLLGFRSSNGMDTNIQGIPPSIQAQAPKRENLIEDNNHTIM
jgi:hypothetical protein